MNLTDSHKAFLITLLISGSVLISLFTLNFKKKQKFDSESYYEIEPEKELTKKEVKILNALEKLKNAKAETNNAFNENGQKKHFHQAYKLIAPPKDYNPSDFILDDNGIAPIIKKNTKPIPKIDKSKLDSFKKVNELLKKQKGENNNIKSTISFSLINRTKNYIPIPVYLCDVDGKIIVDITVNATGNVIDTRINKSSNSTNECLKEHALEYAKNSKFSSNVSLPKQTGSITFNFVGKYN